MKFSIIIPVYNVMPYLDDCIRSILMQSYTDWEVILVDDGSTDGSGELCDKLAQLVNQELKNKNQERIRVIHKENGGLSDARNVGMDMAIGDYLVFLDSDDMLATKDDLHKLVDVIENQDIIAFNNELWYPEDNNRKEPNKLFNHHTPQTFACGLDYLHYFVESRKWGPSAACFYAYRRKFIDAYQLRFSIGLLHEDELFVPLALSKAKVVSIFPQVLYVYRMRSGSITQRVSSKHAESLYIIASQLTKEFAEIAEYKHNLHRIIYNQARRVANLSVWGSALWCKGKRMMLRHSCTLREVYHVFF